MKYSHPIQTTKDNLSEVVSSFLGLTAVLLLVVVLNQHLQFCFLSLHIIIMFTFFSVIIIKSMYRTNKDVQLHTLSVLEIEIFVIRMVRIGINLYYFNSIPAFDFSNFCAIFTILNRCEKNISPH